MLIRHSTFISCSAQQVWDATIDIDNWPEWAPKVQTARRPDKLCFGVGSKARIEQPLQSSAIWTVTDLEKSCSYEWETGGKFFRLCATHEVLARLDGTDCTLSIKLMGPVTRLFASVLALFLWGALAQENRGLKRWCEAGNGHPATQQDPKETRQ